MKQVLVLYASTHGFAGALQHLEYAGLLPTPAAVS